MLLGGDRFLNGGQADTQLGHLIADARKAGIKEEELDAAVDIIAALNISIMESLHQRIKQRVA